MNGFSFFRPSKVKNPMNGILNCNRLFYYLICELLWQIHIVVGLLCVRLTYYKIFRNLNLIKCRVGSRYLINYVIRPTKKYYEYFNRPTLYRQTYITGIIPVLASSLILASVSQKSCSRTERASSETREFKDLTKRDAVDHLKADIEKLISTVPEDQVEAAKKNFAGFLTYYESFLKGEGAIVDWDKIEKLPENAVCLYLHCIQLRISTSSTV